MVKVLQYAESVLPTRWAQFRLIAYRFGDEAATEEVALVLGDVAGQADVLVRVHSECLTGEVFHSLRCDCRPQLDSALSKVAEAGRGIIVYLRQEGRGIGLGDKIRAYALQDRGRDTVDANLELGFDADHRTYERAAAILMELGPTSIQLLTNNPAKIEGLVSAGIRVSGQQDHWVGHSEHSADYIAAKKARMGHLHDKKATGQ